MYLKIFHIQIIFILLFLTTAKGQNAAVILKIKKEIETLASTNLKNSHLSFCLMDVKTKEKVCDYNSDKSMIPASNLKLLTTAGGLEILGEDFNFSTSLYYSGKIDDNVLKGNIYIIGGGDPTLGSSRVKGGLEINELLNLWVNKIRALGIQKIEGNIVANGGKYGEIGARPGWLWGDMGNYYGAPIFGLNINENMYSITFKIGNKIGDSTSIIKTQPEVPGLELINRVLTGPAGSGDKAYIFGAPLSPLRFINGTLPLGNDHYTIKGSLPDPVFYTAYALKNKLLTSGIPVKGPSQAEIWKEQNLSELKLIDTFKSPLLKSIVELTNQKSINLYAEGIYSYLQFQLKDSLKNSKQHFMNLIWKKNGMDTTGIIINDGSGLSVTNRISANHLCTLLSILTTKNYFPVFLNSLPLSGKTGTLYKITKGSVAEGRIRAKSGTQQGVLCYSGYLMSQNKTSFAFSFMLNNYGTEKEKAYPFIEKLFIIMSGLK